MKIIPLHIDLIKYLKRKNLVKKFEKQKILFELDPFYQSLKTELLEPKNMHIWSFRIDKKYRAIFMFLEKDTVEIIDINNHYN